MAIQPVSSSRSIGRAQDRSIVSLIVLGIAYATLALLIRLKPRSHTDIAITRKLQSNEHPYIERVMTFVSWFGFRPQSLALPLSVISLFWWRGKKIESVLLGFAWFSSMASFLTKQVVRRPRPDHTTVRVVIAKTRDTSFPSGHVVHYVTFWGFVAWLLVFRSPNAIGKIIGTYIIAPIIAVVGPSRIYLGHHWFTDVIGSYLLGGAWLSGLIKVHDVLRSGQLDSTSRETWTAGARQWLRS